MAAALATNKYQNINYWIMLSIRGINKNVQFKTIFME